ncbi:GAF domain-containing protein [Nonomuraea sp. NPDC050643]|uniref:GAF domain-containing protein n=1 Tax=Nonomuraea sp. NPDC050643 TaxID=3155660 RepID=UPI0033D8291A
MPQSADTEAIERDLPHVQRRLDHTRHMRSEPRPIALTGCDDLEREELRRAFTRQLLSPSLTLRTAGRTLHAALADWLFIDLLDGGRWRREVLLGRCGPPGELTEALWAPGELAREVHATGRPQVSARIEDPYALGREERGASWAGLFAGGSLICVPISAGGRSYGTLTAVRLGGSSPPFTRSDAALVAELCDLLALRIELDVAIANG